MSGCFTVINSATMKIFILAISWTHAVNSLGWKLRVELICHGMGNCLTLVDTVQQFTKVISLIATLSSSV